MAYQEDGSAYVGRVNPDANKDDDKEKNPDDDSKKSSSDSDEKRKPRKRGRSEDKDKDDDADKNKDKKESSDKNDKSEKDDKGSGGDDAKQAGKRIGLAVKMAQLVQKLMLLQKLLLLLKMLGQMIASAIAAIGSFFAAIGTFVANVAMGVAAFLGVSAVAATVGLAGLAVIIVSVVIAGAVALIQQNELRIDDYHDCKTDVEIAASGSVDNVDEMTIETAGKVYSVLSTYGLADENIAGILGNWSRESGIDPTSVETIYNEAYVYGERKQYAESLDFKIADFDPAYWHKHPRIEYMGIGIGQWTNGRNRLLLAYANGAGLPWYNLDLQLAFMIAPSSQGGDDRSIWVSNWRYTPEDNPSKAADSFCTYWEGATPSDIRRDSAGDWFLRLAELAVDVDYANSIIDLSGAVMANATDSATANALRGCNMKKKIDNSTLAMAAVSMAWSSEDLSYNNGTSVYQTVHDAVLSGDGTYKACDRVVTTAVRWSGYDDSFPLGNVAHLYMYMLVSDRWSEVENWNGSPDSLLPGDILIRKDENVSHTLIYVGNEAIKTVFPDAPDDYCVVSGSLDTRSAGCGGWLADEDEGYNTYAVFRNVSKEPNSIYKNAAMGSVYH